MADIDTDEETATEDTYCIKRHWHPSTGKGREDLDITGLTLEEAKAHCEDPDTASPEDFDGFYKE